METDNDVPNLEEETSEWTGTYTWRVENWTQLIEENIYSPEFEVGGYTWRLLVFPRGNGAHGSADHVSIYLDFPEASFTPPRMCPRVELEIIAVKNPNSGESMKREARLRFSTEVTALGFPLFISRQDALNPQNGYLVNDTLTLRANIKIEGKHDSGRTSRLKTGFVDIKCNEKTSLLSSFVQCLFNIKVFRNAVFQIPTVESNDPPKSLPLALQQLFYKLKYQNRSAKTKDLIEALDWDSTDRCLRHDVPGIQRKIFDKLCEEDEARSVRDCISKLFMGEHSKYTESASIQGTQTCKQSYIDINLDILECKDIYASLERFCQIDLLEGDDHSNETSPEAGESKQCILFDSFPTVLQFNFKRCYYNPDRKAILKTNLYYEFYGELDLDYNDRELQSKNADRSIENKYRLHSVVVHEDGPRGGYYFAFVRCNEKWYKFDDEVVKAVSAEEAINGQFGDQHGTISANFSRVFEGIEKSAAVKLIYVRKSEWNAVIFDGGRYYLPEQARERFEKERKEKEERQKEKEEVHLYVNIKLATNCHLAEQIGRSYYLALPDLDTGKNYRMYKKRPFEDFKEMVSKDFGIPKHLQRFWFWYKQPNSTIRDFKHLNENETDLNTVLDLRHLRDRDSPLHQAENALMIINLFLELPENATLTGDTLHPIQRNELLIFLEYYDPELSKRSYLGHVFVEITCQFRLIFEKAKKMAGLAPEEEVIGFREVKHSPAVTCSVLTPDSTPEKSQLIQGDIIIIQKVAANSFQYEYPTVESFLEFIQSRVAVTFKPLKNPKDEGFELELLKTLTYEQVTNALAKRLQIDDPKKLRLTLHDINARMPQKRPIKYNGMESLEQMILYRSRYTHILYYEVLDIQLPYLETSKCITIHFFNGKGERQSEHHLRFPKDDRVSDLVNALKRELGKDYNSCDIRVMEICSSKVFKVLDYESTLKHLRKSYWICRAEVIPEDQKNLKPDEFVVLFRQCKLDDDYVTEIGNSLLVKVKKGETVREVGCRIQKIQEISDEEFNHWTIAYRAHPMHPVEYLREEDEILAKFPNVALSGRVNGNFVGDGTSFMALLHEDTRLGH